MPSSLDTPTLKRLADSNNDMGSYYDRGLMPDHPLAKAELQTQHLHLGWSQALGILRGPPLSFSCAPLLSYLSSVFLDPSTVMNSSLQSNVQLAETLHLQEPPALLCTTVLSYSLASLCGCLSLLLILLFVCHLCPIKHK